MTKGLYASNYVIDILKSNEDLRNKVKNRIYPVMVTDGTDFPFILVLRSSNYENDTKDNLYSDVVTVTVAIQTRKYDIGVDIAQLVRCILEKKKFETDEYYIPQITLKSSNEGYTSKVYVQILDFEVTIC